MDRHYYDPNVKEMSWHHEIVDEKCYPMVCQMPTLAIGKVMGPWSLQHNLSLAIMGLENLQMCISQYEDYDWQAVWSSIWWQILTWPVSCSCLG